jgi:hypothetical protein
MFHQGKVFVAVFTASATFTLATFTAIQSVSARPLSTPSATSNALPLLETVAVRGMITNIDGNRVQLRLPNDQVRTYRISRNRQEELGLAVGSEITLHVRRLNNLVTAINPPIVQTSERQSP